MDVSRSVLSGEPNVLEGALEGVSTVPIAIPLNLLVIKEIQGDICVVQTSGK